MTKAPNVFAGLALQTTCRAINNLETTTLIRRQMSQTIEELNKTLKKASADTVANGGK